MISALLASVVAVAPFGELEIVDEIDCTLEDHSFADFPEGASRTVELLGSKCRWLPVQDGEVAGYFKYRLGGGKRLKEDGGYVVVLEYPDDVPRNYVLHNRGNGSDRGFSTGGCYGDADKAKYVDNHVESVDVPHSGEWRRWAEFSPLAGCEDGFDFYVSQYSREHDPFSQGVAVRRILLCEIPDEEKIAAKIVRPAGLPYRHVFWREEMGDGNISLGMVKHRFRQMRFLGIDVYMKDLLEFGHVQHWDPHWIAENWMWGSTREMDNLWEKIVKEAGKRGIEVLPYYEWSGPREFSNCCRTFGGGEHYTHITWSEASIDITDPRALEETEKLLDGTILRFKNDAKFLGAMFRTRPTQWAISFSDEALARFGTTREEIRASGETYSKYLDWWYARRAGFLEALRKYLAANGLPEAIVLLDGEYSEPGPAKDADRDAPTPTWGEWEWHHACPADRPSTFPKMKSVSLAMPVNRMYSVADPQLFSAYADADGMTTIVKHSPLNEHMQESIGFYTMNDTEKAGRASMMLEVEAMANGDVGNICYLVGSSFARGFPEAAREFYRNFLALPAMRSQIVPGACAGDEIVLREIDCGKSVYYAIVNTGAAAKKDAHIVFPGRKADTLFFPATGRRRRLEDGALTLDLEPWQLVAVRAE